MSLATGSLTIMAIFLPEKRLYGQGQKSLERAALSCSVLHCLSPDVEQVVTVNW